MAQNITTGHKALCEQANKEVESVNVDRARAMMADEGATLVDIRDIRELKREGKISGAFHAPRGMLEFWIDPDSPYFKDVFAEDKKFVFHCASGWRSALSVATLNDMGFEAAHLKEGFSTWADQGGPVEMPEPRK